MLHPPPSFPTIVVKLIGWPTPESGTKRQDVVGLLGVHLPWCRFFLPGKQK